MATTLLIGLLTIVAISLDAFLRVGNGCRPPTPTATRSPLATTVQRLIRTEVEPAPPSASGLPSSPCSRSAPRPPTPPPSTPTSGRPRGPPRWLASLVTHLQCHRAAAHRRELARPPPRRPPSAIPGHRNRRYTRLHPVRDQCRRRRHADLHLHPSRPRLQPAAVHGARHVHHHHLRLVAPSPVPVTRESTTCPGDTVQGVEVNLQVKSPRLDPDQQDTVIYRLSATSQVFDPNVG